MLTKLTNKERSYIWVRLVLQSNSLLGATTFAQDVREAILQVYIEAAPRLVRCVEARDKLAAYEERVRSEHAGLPPKYLPKLDPIEGDAERFLYEAKNYLRDLTGVLRAAFGATCKDARDFARAPTGSKRSAAEKIAQKALGPDSRLTKLLAHDSGWIGEVVRLRNAVEHPGGHSGTLTVQNFGFVGQELQPPSWFMNEAAPTEIVADMTAVCNLLLEFGENLLGASVEAHFTPPHFRIVEVPEDQRPSDMPVRLVLLLEAPSGA